MVSCKTYRHIIGMIEKWRCLWLTSRWDSYGCRYVRSTLYHLHRQRFESYPKFGIFLGHCCTIKNNLNFNFWPFSNSSRSSYLNTTSPRKSFGACQVKPSPDLGDGLTCVAVFSSPSQLINFIRPSADGANRPTTRYGGLVLRACTMKPPNVSSGGVEMISMFKIWPCPTDGAGVCIWKGDAVSVGAMPPPWNGSSVSQTVFGAPLGNEVDGVRWAANRAMTTNGSGSILNLCLRKKNIHLY